MDFKEANKKEAESRRTTYIITEVLERMLQLDKTRHTKNIIKEMCNIENLKDKPFCKEIYDAYDELFIRGFYK